MLSSSAIFRFSSLKSVIFLSLFLSPALSAQDYSFEQIGFLPGEKNDMALAYSLSRDGNTVVGVTAKGGFVWSPGKSITPIQGEGLSRINFISVSANGSVIAGSGDNNGYSKAFRWTEKKGLQFLGYLSGAGTRNSSHVTAISQDGQVIVGDSLNMNGHNEAFRWTETGGMQGLGFLGIHESGFGQSTVRAASYNGSVLVGDSTSKTRPQSYREAFIWSESGGLQGLGFLDDDAQARSMATHVSDDGLVVAGISAHPNKLNEVFRWTKELGMQGLGFIEVGEAKPESLLTDMSSDGSVLVGTSTTARSTNTTESREAFRWTEETGMVGLGYLGIGTHTPESKPAAISADGSTIVGTSSTTQDNIELFVWRSETGMFSLVDFMSTQGIDLNGWALVNIDGVSGNGEVIAGTGYNPDKVSESWLIRIPKSSVTPDPPPGPEKPAPEGKPETPETPETPPVGFISVNELNRSMSDMTSVPMSGLSVAQGALQDQRFISAEQCASDKVSDKRYCTFITGTGAFWRGDGTQGRGSAGMAVRLSPSLSLGMSAYLGNQHYDLRLSGKNKMNSYGGALFLNYSEGKQGLRAFGAVTASHLDYDLRRHYRNGSYNISRSSGESSGRAIGGMVRLGWAFSPQDRISAIPFAELSWAKATIKGYREHNGTFPIDFDSRKANETDMRLGSELRYDLTDVVNINGGIAWVHRLSGGLDRVSGTVIGWSETSVSAAKLPTNWSEVSLGASYKLTADMNLSASTTSTIGRSHQPDTSVRAGFSMSF
ncbi:autotransporter domain-containing protein [Pragia fontium]|uniref:autotransporter domain-containing protein n=1 Tax=Pragia fontium TaxID=82985 RepID=UPI00069A3E92|nr:autotransporter domain-containing protein [Pragia fontium]